MKTRLLGGVAALVIAIIGTVLLITYVNGAERRALANTETEDVYVVQKTIAAGTPVSSLGSSIALKPVPKGVLPEGSLNDLGDIEGKVSSVALEPGETLLADRFVDPSSLSGPGRVSVPEGQEEFTLKLPVERVAGGNLKAGDTVGILLSFPKDDGAPAQTQQTFHKVLVTAVQAASGKSASSGPASGGAQDPNTSASTGDYLVTLARSAAEAERIVYAAEFGKVYIAKEPGTALENNGAAISRAQVFR